MQFSWLCLYELPRGGASFPSVALEVAVGPELRLGTRWSPPCALLPLLLGHHLPSTNEHHCDIPVCVGSQALTNLLLWDFGLCRGR